VCLPLPWYHIYGSTCTYSSVYYNNCELAQLCGTNTMCQLGQSIWLDNRIPNGTPARANRQVPTRHTRLATAVRENRSRTHGIESAVLVNADGAAVRIRVARSPPHLLPSGTTMQPPAPRKRCVPSHCYCNRWRAKAVGQRSTGEDTPRKKETPRPPPTSARVLSTPIQTAANHARLVLSTPIPTAANHFLRFRRPPRARSSSAEQCARDCDTDTALATTLHCSAK
jgi:hypothetical protein